ncbi:CoA-transferase subunit beta [Usitatibacter palustris]|uniref:3-oxoadipate CoA-transferase subunit B n=1 Tax=Usitatibacter palustris TaxID=2732487 RepID=A0A6M4H726_9PROT|nr:CoA-transferase subunit beta [Usitatibacter palustris]QJR15431.1 3-oxoadipate CoA-transferase subunit B [Usitatibacter palustris]
MSFSLSHPGYTPAEIMTIEASRRLKNGTVCFVGIGLPSAAANLARLMHAPDVVLIYESGTIGAKPDVLPLSIGDGELAEYADTVVSVPEIFRYWVQGGRIDVGFLGAAQVDRFGNLNSTIIGTDYAKPKVRLPGAGGAPEIASNAKETWIIIKQNLRTFVEKVDFLTSVGHLTGGDSREKSGARGAGPTAVISDLGVLVPDPVSKELTLAALHPGVTIEQAKAATGWDLKIASKVEAIAPPTQLELVTLRDLHERTARAHGVATTTD